MPKKIAPDPAHVAAVKARHPDAVAEREGTPGAYRWYVYDRPLSKGGPGSIELGSERTEASAWAKAAGKLEPRS